jgi:hypothetical protein
MRIALVVVIVAILATYVSAQTTQPAGTSAPADASVAGALLGIIIALLIRKRRAPAPAT